MPPKYTPLCLPTAFGAGASGGLVLFGLAGGYLDYFDAHGVGLGLHPLAEGIGKFLGAPNPTAT